MPFKSINLHEVKTYPLSKRKNLVTKIDLVFPGRPLPPFDSQSLIQVAESVIKACKRNKAVIWMMGAHVIKAGLGPLLIDLMRRQAITHLAGNGAVAIHDFELALIGETSEDVATSIEDGTFGIAEETGALIHRALREGTHDGLGYGSSLGRFIAEQEFPHREISVLYQAWQQQIPFTIHITLGADIIHQHPDCNFGISGTASGQDFLIFCQSVAGLDSGVFLNFGSAVTGPEVFLKALSISRNLGHKVEGFTTANFDLIALPQDYHSPISSDKPAYYYRPLKNIINRPTSLSGQGYHVQGDHRVTIPNLHNRITAEISRAEVKSKLPSSLTPTFDLQYQLERVAARCPSAAEAVKGLSKRKPELDLALTTLCQAFLIIAQSFERGGRLFIYGNGGSMADAQHIVGELQKSFAKKRPLNNVIKERLNKYEPEKILSTHLESGLPALVLGINPALNSAIDNDFDVRWLNVAQELQVLAKTGDVFLGISTSGKAQNIKFAGYTARALGCQEILLTGESHSEFATFVDVAIHAPGTRTELVQESHISLYHCLCDMLERDFFGDE